MHPKPIQLTHPHVNTCSLLCFIVQLPLQNSPRTVFCITKAPFTSHRALRAPLQKSLHSVLPSNNYFPDAQHNYRPTSPHCFRPSLLITLLFLVPPEQTHQHTTPYSYHGNTTTLQFSSSLQPSSLSSPLPLPFRVQLKYTSALLTRFFSSQPMATRTKPTNASPHPCH